MGTEPNQELQDRIEIKVLLAEGAQPPYRSYPTDVGWDLVCLRWEHRSEYGAYLLDTGVSVELPPGYYIDLVPRSSIFKMGFLMTNSVGIIDPDYRGTIHIPLVYVGPQIEGAQAAVDNLLGKRVAQMIVRKQVPSELRFVDKLTHTERGSNGLGSTGAR